MISIKSKLSKLKSLITGKEQKPETIFKPLAKIVSQLPRLNYYKNMTIQKRAVHMHRDLHMIMIDMVRWVEQEFGFTPVITETVTLAEEDAALGRKSVSHQQGRAFDMRTRGWTKEQILKFIEHFNKKYGHLGAISARSGKPCLIVHHDAGTGPHFHVQIKADFAVAGIQDAIKKLNTEERA